MQFYSGNFLDGTAAGKGGVPLTYRSGLALETQHFPELAERAVLPLDHPAAGSGAPLAYGLPLRRATRVTSCR